MYIEMLRVFSWSFLCIGIFGVMVSCILATNEDFRKNVKYTLPVFFLMSIFGIITAYYFGL